MGDIGSDSSEEPDTEVEEEKKEEAAPEEVKKIKLSEMTPYEREEYLR